MLLDGLRPIRRLRLLGYRMAPVTHTTCGSLKAKHLKGHSPPNYGRAFTQ
ncbi:MAG: hypothetical protein ACI92C_001507 [Neolewinella sp.]|jgi:hypothetical protein